MELHLKVIGLILILLSLVHVLFPKYFNWRTEFAGISLINRQVMYVHTFFIALTVALMGFLCLMYPGELIHTKLGNKITCGLFIFWNLRLWIQFFGYSSKLWRGKFPETVVHILFSLLWTYFSSIFFYIYWMNKDL